MTPDRTFKDGEQFEFVRAGQIMKAYCPQRPGACVRMHENLFRFDIRAGDFSTLDGNRESVPQRSQIAGYGPTCRARAGGTTYMRLRHLIEPPKASGIVPVDGIVERWFNLIFQLMQTADAGEYHNAAFGAEVYAASTTGPNRLRIKHTTAPGANTAGVVVTSPILADVPYDLGRFNEHEIEFKDSLGDPGGKIVAVLNGTKIVDYAGPTGFRNVEGVYPGAGIYGNAAAQPLVAWVADLGFEFA